jgi:hypothetical protein
VGDHDLSIFINPEEKLPLPLPSLSDLRYFVIALEELCSRPPPPAFWRALLIHAYLKYVRQKDLDKSPNDGKRRASRPLSFKELREILALVPSAAIEPLPTRSHFRLMASRALKVASLIQVKELSKRAEEKAKEALAKLNPFEVALALFFSYHLCDLERHLEFEE